MTAPAKIRYLEIAADMLNGHVAGEPAHVHLAAHVKLADVAERIGVARSTLYRWWPSQRDYWRDLVLYAVTRPTVVLADLFQLPEEFTAAAGDTAEAVGFDAVLDVFRPRLAAAQSTLAADPRHMLRIGLAGYPTVPGLSDMAADAERRERQQGAAMIAIALGAAGRRPIAPLTTLDLMTMVSLMTDGLIAYGRSSASFLDHRVVLDGETDRPWSLTALAARAILTELTKPGPMLDAASHGGPTPPSPRSSGTSTPDVGLEALSEVQIHALEAGIQIIAGPDAKPAIDGTAVALGHVTLARVARQAGVTRRQMYHLWPSQADFRRDLIDHLVDRDRVDYMARFDTSALDAAALEDRDRFVLEMVDAINTYRRSEEPPAPGATFALQPLMNDSGMVQWREAGLARRIAAQRERVETLARTWGMEPIDGLTIEDVTTLAIMGAAGSERLHRAELTAIRYDLGWRGGRYSTYAILNQALMEHVLTDEAEGGRRRGRSRSS